MAFSFVCPSPSRVGQSMKVNLKQNIDIVKRGLNESVVSPLARR